MEPITYGLLAPEVLPIAMIEQAQRNLARSKSRVEHPPMQNDEPMPAMPEWEKASKQVRQKLKETFALALELGIDINITCPACNECYDVYLEDFFLT